MLRTQLKTLNIATKQDQALLSKGQKAFNKLIQQIEKKREQLFSWETAIPPYQKQYVEELLPLIDRTGELQCKMVQTLDQAMTQKGLTKTERRILSDLITNLAGQLLAERDDAELKAIYNRHSGSDYDDEEAANRDGMMSMLEDLLGVELDDDLDLNSPEDMLKVHAQMQEKQAQHAADREARDAKKKKSARQIAKETQQQAEEQQVSLSIREVYRKLASALHPDRETDPQERERKNALMQRANQAYARKNLLELLELQLEIEHINQNALNNISEDRLKHYNKILKEQLFELDQAIEQLEDDFRMQFGISPFEKITPGNIMRQLGVDIAMTQSGIHHLQNDLHAFEDIKNLKIWLKEMSRQAKRHAYDEIPF